MPGDTPHYELWLLSFADDATFRPLWFAPRFFARGHGGQINRVGHQATGPERKAVLGPIRGKQAQIGPPVFGTVEDVRPTDPAWRHRM